MWHFRRHRPNLGLSKGNQSCIRHFQWYFHHHKVHLKLLGHLRSEEHKLLGQVGRFDKNLRCKKYKHQLKSKSRLNIPRMLPLFMSRFTHLHSINYHHHIFHCRPENLALSYLFAVSSNFCSLSWTCGVASRVSCWTSRCWSQRRSNCFLEEHRCSRYKLEA
jgi:hypothetical protein